MVIVPLPEISVHAPVPTVALLAAITVVFEVMQRVWLGPALAEVGTSNTTIETVDVFGAHGAFAIVQAKIFVPNANPVIEVVGESEFVIVPPPEINVHSPEPAVALFAAITVLGEEIHNV